eukprot:GFUD01045861.1.p1 GENE.GFUD01045861.1~~GFUD01045861.1.p1  ORF type:complete len:109 (-),score=10.76 GFUD01045861.1:70-396(-)
MLSFSCSQTSHHLTQADSVRLFHLLDNIIHGGEMSYLLSLVDKALSNISSSSRGIRMLCFFLPLEVDALVSVVKCAKSRSVKSYLDFLKNNKSIKKIAKYCATLKVYV